MATVDVDGAEIREGDRVAIESGSHVGKTGVVAHRSGEYLSLQLDGGGATVLWARLVRKVELPLWGTS